MSKGALAHDPLRAYSLDTLIQQFEELEKLRDRVRRAEARSRSLRAYQRSSRRLLKSKRSSLLRHRWRVH
jgi:hypothetical protein